MQAPARIREIPYNYTSFSDREIVIRFLGEKVWQALNKLRDKRQTGRSARMLFEVLGDMWVVARNPFIQEDLQNNRKRRQSLISALTHRLDQILERADDNQLVIEINKKARKAVVAFEANLVKSTKLRQKIKYKLAKVTNKDNIDFSGHARVAHVTDATDWRVEYPFVVIFPDTEKEMAGIVTSCIKLGLTIIPRGGGTGYTGGAIPLTTNSVVINTEKLTAIGKIEYRKLSGLDKPRATIFAEAGVVTRHVANAAEKHNYIFAVDPTSQDASTIGGNVSMNAGGKKAVLWGTTLDNLVSWTMVDPNGDWMDVERLDFNGGKIHEQEQVRFVVKRTNAKGKKTQPDELIKFAGKDFRKIGLGKDVTDKFLGGLPGIQKEGCDGLITSAVFVLHTLPKHTQTVCMEFYSEDIKYSVEAIVELKNYLKQHKQVVLSGLEHLDELYIKAVNYSPKADRSQLPKMLLIADISSENLDNLEKVVSGVDPLLENRDVESFVAKSPQARKLFWADRAKTAAIAAHTNAFKLNEDVVIPLEKLGDYSFGISRINLELELKNKIAIGRKIKAFIETESLTFIQSNQDLESSDEQQAIWAQKQTTAMQVLDKVLVAWEKWLNTLDEPPLFTEENLQGVDATEGYTAENTNYNSLAEYLLANEQRISYRHQIMKPLNEIFSGGQMDALSKHLDTIHAKERKRRLFVALHMHAGDGNVHTNIPVNSHDYEMMKAADSVVHRIMELAISLDGVISGEHGIGITKYQFLDETIKQRFVSYKNKVDPNGHFNKGKLMPGSGLKHAYTPSLQLVQQESLILEASELTHLNDSIKDCLRCGKCKPECSTHVPEANLLYSPRNKILTTGLLLEAYLYEEQTRRGISLQHFEAMNDIADHCTICHRCLKPCPVNIDFGVVTSEMRKILINHGKRKSNTLGKLSSVFLDASNPKMINVLRKGMIDLGYKGQRLASTVVNLAPSIKKQKEKPRPTNGTLPPIQEQVIHFLNRKMPPTIPARPMRSLLKMEDERFVSVLRDPEKTNDQSEAVFYFPGCGSERLYSQVGLATLAMLYKTGVQTVLPPGYLCCGYPQSASGEAQKSKDIIMKNRVLFHRVANTLNYLDIKTVVVSCGTCLDQLQDYQFDKIFPDSRIIDIHEYLLEKGVSVGETKGQHYLYHDPCHSPIKNINPVAMTEKLLNASVTLSDRCCGESGSFALSRPDIATQVKYRKVKELNKNIAEADVKPTKILTNCPACLQGLERLEDDSKLDADYIVVEMIKNQNGENWLKSFVKEVNNGGIEKVLL